MTVFMFLIFLISVGWLVFAFWLTDSKYVIAWGICSIVMLLFYIRGLYYFALNDFEYF